MKWSPQQEKALTDVSRWLKRPDRPVFRLFGYAGTGKTTLARHLAEGTDGDVLFAAYTGKAAQVLRSKGAENARTIHSLIYRPGEPDDKEGGEGDETPTFRLRRSSPVGQAALVIIDECSMVGEDIGRDLMSFGTPILVLGDPGQLPPVSGGGFFTDAEPDVMLEEVHRQAADDPIVTLAMKARLGEEIVPGTYGDSRVITRHEVTAEMVMAADQTLVGINRSRHLYNGRIRALSGFTDPMPQVADRLVCLRNNASKGLLNGSLWRVAALGPQKGSSFRLRVEQEAGEGGGKTSIRVRPEMFEGRLESLPWNERRRLDEFDYGYALTVHKAQGSQWDKVVLFDESYAFREHRTRWLYTGITRASAQLTIVR